MDRNNLQLIEWLAFIVMAVLWVAFLVTLSWASIIGVLVTLATGAYTYLRIRDKRGDW